MAKLAFSAILLLVLLLAVARTSVATSEEILATLPLIYGWGDANGLGLAELARSELPLPPICASVQSDAYTGSPFLLTSGLGTILGSNGVWTMAAHRDSLGGRHSFFAWGHFRGKTYRTPVDVSQLITAVLDYSAYVVNKIVIVEETVLLGALRLADGNYTIFSADFSVSGTPTPFLGRTASMGSPKGVPTLIVDNLASAEYINRLHCNLDLCVTGDQTTLITWGKVSPSGTAIPSGSIQTRTIGHAISQISAGAYHFIIFDSTNNTFYGYGDNTNMAAGCLSVGGRHDGCVVQGITGKLSAGLASGIDFNMMISGANLFTWGSNAYGQLGRHLSSGNYDFANSVTWNVAWGNPVKVSAVRYTGYFLTDIGKVYAFGSDLVDPTSPPGALNGGMMGGFLPVLSTISPIQIITPSWITAAVPSVSSYSNVSSIAIHVLGQANPSIRDNIRGSRSGLGSVPGFSNGNRIVLGWGNSAHGVRTAADKEGWTFDTRVSTAADYSLPMVVGDLPTSVWDQVTITGDGAMFKASDQWVRKGKRSTAVQSDLRHLAPIVSGTGLPDLTLDVTYANSTGGSSTTSCAIFESSGVLKLHCWSSVITLPAIWPLTLTTDFVSMDLERVITCGNHHCAISATTSTGAYVWTFADSPGIQLGNSRSLYYNPTESPLFYSGETTPPLVAAGDNFTLIRTSTGLEGFGLNDAGQLPGVAISPSPMIELSLTPMSNTIPTDMRAGRAHVLYLLPNGTIVAWGSSSDGQAGSLAAIVAPQNLPIAQVSNIACSVDTSFAMTTTGNLLVWGRGGSTRIWGADSPYPNSFTPMAVPITSALGIGLESPVFMTSSSFADAMYVIVTVAYVNSVPTPLDNNIVAFGSQYDSNAPTLSGTDPKALTFGSVRPLPLYSSTSKLVKMTAGPLATFALTDDGGIYAYGTIPDSIYDATSDLSVFVPGRHMDGERILFEYALDFVAFDGGLIIAKINPAYGTSYAWYQWSNDSKLATPQLGPNLLSLPTQQYPSTGSHMACSASICCISIGQLFCYESVNSLDAFGNPLVFSYDAEFVTVSGLGDPAVYINVGDQILKLSGPALKNAFDVTNFNITDHGGIAALEAGWGHVLCLTGNGTVFASGRTDYGQAGTTGSDLTVMTRLDTSNIFATIVQIAAVDNSSILLDSNAAVWIFGYNPFDVSLTVAVDTDFDVVVSSPVPQTISVALLPAGQLPNSHVALLSRSSGLTDSSQSGMVIYSYFRTDADFAPYSTSPYWPPPGSPNSNTPAPVACSPNPPTADEGWTCIDGSWHYSGPTLRLTTSSPLVVDSTSSAPVIIEGDLTVGPGGLVINIQAESFSSSVAGASRVVSKSSPLLNVTGCVTLQGPITANLNEKATKKVPDGKTLNIVESSCRQNPSTAQQIVRVTTAKSCRKIAAQGNETPTGTGRQSLSASFKVTSNSCSYWWIILVCVLASVVVFVAIFAVVVMTTNLKHVFMPYKGSN